ASSSSRTRSAPSALPGAGTRPRSRPRAADRIAKANNSDQTSAKSFEGLRRFGGGEFAAHARLQQPCTGVHGLDVRYRRVGEARELDHRADERLELRGAPGLDVLQHRRLMASDARRAFDAPLERNAKSDAELARHRLRFAHHRRGESASRRFAADAVELRAGKRADRIEAEVAPEL